MTHSAALAGPVAAFEPMEQVDYMAERDTVFDWQVKGPQISDRQLDVRSCANLMRYLALIPQKPAAQRFEYGLERLQFWATVLGIGFYKVNAGCRNNG